MKRPGFSLLGEIAIPRAARCGRSPICFLRPITVLPALPSRLPGENWFTRKSECKKFGKCHLSRINLELKVWWRSAGRNWTIKRVRLWERLAVNRRIARKPRIPRRVNFTSDPGSCTNFTWFDKVCRIKRSLRTRMQQKMTRCKKLRMVRNVPARMITMDRVLREGWTTSSRIVYTRFSVQTTLSNWISARK